MRMALSFFIFALLSLPSLGQTVESAEKETLKKGEWERVTVEGAPRLKRGERVHLRRALQWVESEEVVRTCWQHRYGTVEFGGQVEVTNEILDLSCDFITYSDSGWGLMTPRFRTREAFLRSQSPWASPQTTD